MPFAHLSNDDRLLLRDPLSAHAYRLTAAAERMMGAGDEAAVERAGELAAGATELARLVQTASAAPPTLLPPREKTDTEMAKYRRFFDSRAAMAAGFTEPHKDPQ